MSTLRSRFIERARIPLETTNVVVSKDGSIRNAGENEQADSIEVTATADMLPVARDSHMRQWGFLSVLGFFVAEGEQCFFATFVRRSG